MIHIKNFLQRIVFPIILGLLIAKTLQMFVLQFNLVSGPSMEPTLQNNDYLITEKISLYLEGPERGDIVIVKNNDKLIIKRVIGIDGDEIEFLPTTNTNGETYYELSLNGVILKEHYIKEKMFLGSSKKYILGPNEVFVLGDNRNNSLDSRAYGVFKESDLEGRVFLEIRDQFKFY